MSIIERECGRVEAQRARAAIEELPLDVVPVFRNTVLAAAHVKAQLPISHADAFAVVTAQERDGVVVTGDPEFRSVETAGLVPVEWLPR